MLVLLQQNSIAHYRKRLFQTLRKQPEFNFQFVADTKSDTAFMEIVEPGDELQECLHVARTYQFQPIKGIPLTWQPKTIALASSLKPDIVVALGSPYSLTTWALVIYGRLTNLPIALWTHGLRRKESGPKWWIRGAQFRLATGLLLYGDTAKSLLLQKGLPDSSLRVIRNSLDTPMQKLAYAESLQISQEETRQNLNIVNADRVLIFTGRLQPVKELHELIRLIAELKKLKRATHALIVGTGQEGERLKQLSIALNVAERVHFHGPCHDERKLAQLYRASDACLIPSGAGLVVLHALTYGTPVITHDQATEHFPEVEAIQQGETGFLYKFRELADLVRVTESALYPNSPKLQMSAACISTIESKFSCEAHATRITDALRFFVQKSRNESSL